MQPEPPSSPTENNNGGANMVLWNSWCHTDPSTTKSFTGGGGFRGTAIDAQSQIKLATEAWGPMGVYWGVKDEVFGCIDLDGAGDYPPIRKITYCAILFYPPRESLMPIVYGPAQSLPKNDGPIQKSDMKLIKPDSCVRGEMGIHSDIDLYRGGRPNSDIFKKVSTDALTKGLSRLGMNSDVFEGKFDDNKYVQDMREEFAKDKDGRPRASAPPASAQPQPPSDTCEPPIGVFD